MKLLTTVPFSGFYESIHSEAIDREDYARAYVNELSSGLEFDRLDSPREYNFTTDRIFAKMPLIAARYMLDNVNVTIFTKLCKDTFTSYDGFISHYSPDWTEWDKDITKWDHNQLGVLLTAFINDDSVEEQIADTLASNGYTEIYDD